MSPLPGTVEAIVLIVCSGGNSRCSSFATDGLLEITADRASNALAGPRAFIVSAFMIVYMDASRWQGFIRCDGRQIRLEVYIRPVCADRSLRALMDFADPRLISPKSSKLDQSFRLGGSRSDLFAIPRGSPCATF